MSCCRTGVVADAVEGLLLLLAMTTTRGVRTKVAVVGFEGGGSRAAVR